MVDLSDLYIVLVALLFSAFFSGMEIAFISANKLQIEVQAKDKNLISRILSNFVHNKDKFLSTTLIGNNIALVLYGIFMAKLLVPVLEKITPTAINSPIVLLLEQTLLATLLVLITAEFLPKSLFIINPNRVLRLLAIPMQIIYYILYLATLFITFLSKWVIVNILKMEYDDSKPVYGLTDLNNYIKNISNIGGDDDLGDAIVDIDEQIFSNALEFKSLRVRDCMIPRTEISAIDLNEDSLDDLRNTFIDSGHTKILVYKDSIDDIIGYCHAIQLFKKPGTIEEIIKEIFLVPETMMARDLMLKFISEHKSLAVVVDEYGGTSGLVSIEDIIEEIIGEIEDEHDTEVLLEENVSKNCYHLSARLEIDYLNEEYNWNLPIGEYETLGGLILSITENIPEENEVVQLGKHQAKILSIEDYRINSVELLITA
ncbi:MAG: hemolysin [Bacteroidetes bacterium]|nr:MAG: hemolysin [Bacteroidota bacterium]